MTHRSTNPYLTPGLGAAPELILCLKPVILVPFPLPLIQLSSQ